MKQARPKSGNSGSGPLIVVGMWRSGSSLLYSLLNQHPRIALMYEADLFLLQSLFSSRGSKADWRERWEFWNSAFTRHQLCQEQIPAAVPDIAAGAAAVWKEYAGSAIRGEKSPNYYDCLPELARLFPGARFIIIWRDLADICRSIVRAREGSSFFSKPGILHRAVIGYRKLKQGRDALVTRQIPVHEIQYEEMIQDPSAVMRGVCAFLDIAFDPRMTSLQGSDASPIYQGAHHEQVKGGKILSFKASPEVLPAGMLRKIQGYVAYWRSQSGGAWPCYPKDKSRCEIAEDTPGAPGFELAGPVERFRDELLFRFLRAVDRFTAWVYCYAPFGVLQRYRSFKNRRHGLADAVPVATVRDEKVRVIPEEASIR